MRKAPKFRFRVYEKEYYFQPGAFFFIPLLHATKTYIYANKRYSDPSLLSGYLTIVQVFTLIIFPSAINDTLLILQLVNAYLSKNEDR